MHIQLCGSISIESLGGELYFLSIFSFFFYMNLKAWSCFCDCCGGCRCPVLDKCVTCSEQKEGEMWFLIMKKARNYDTLGASYNIGFHTRT